MYPKLETSKPFKLPVKYQRYGICSMMSPNSLPVEKRHYAENQNVYGFKLYGVCETEKQMEDFSVKLQKQNKNFNICPFNIGEVMEFDVDTSENNPNTKIIYREEELNKTIGNKDFNADVVEENTVKEEKTQEIYDSGNDSDNNSYEESPDNEQKKDYSFIHLTKQQRWCCVQFYPAKAYELKKAEVIKGRKIISFKVHGVFDTMDDAVKYRKKYKEQLIFVGEVGKWIAFHWDLLKNTEQHINDTNLMCLNNFIEIYEKALQEETFEEERRKNESLEGANVVTGKYDVMGTSKKETEEREHKTNYVETEEEQLEREIKELKEKEQVLNKVVCSKDEFDKKCDEILELHKILVSEK